MVGSRLVIAAALLSVAFGVPGTAGAQSDSAFEQVLDILRSKDLIDAEEEERVRAAYAAEQKQDGALPGWLEGFDFGADFRARFDGTYYDEDATGSERENRGRGRYRARFGFTKDIGDSLEIGMRLASGTEDHRSGNVSFGTGGDDAFDPDSLFIDRFYGVVKLVDDSDMSVNLAVGKISSPFDNFEGPDNLIFDHDISPEGAYLRSSFALSENARLYASFGGFVLDEVSRGKDPKLFAAQTGLELEPAPGVSLGFRASGYRFHALDGDFAAAALDEGNLVSAFDADGDEFTARLGEASAYFGFDLAGNWPLLVYGQFVHNFDAESAVIGGVPIGDQADAWGLGFELGSSSLLQFGGGWFHVEANSVMAQFTDSDLFEGMTNREGFMVFARRRITSGLELRVTYFDGEEIKSSAPFATSVSNARRRRVQADALFSF